MFLKSKIFSSNFNENNLFAATIPNLGTNFIEVKQEQTHLQCHVVFIRLNRKLLLLLLLLLLKDKIMRNACSKTANYIDGGGGGGSGGGRDGDLKKTR